MDTHMCICIYAYIYVLCFHMGLILNRWMCFECDGLKFNIVLHIEYHQKHSHIQAWIVFHDTQYGIIHEFVIFNMSKYHLCFGVLHLVYLFKHIVSSFFFNQRNAFSIFHVSKFTHCTHMSIEWTHHYWTHVFFLSLSRSHYENHISSYIGKMHILVYHSYSTLMELTAFLGENSRLTKLMENHIQTVCTTLYHPNITLV